MEGRQGSGDLRALLALVVLLVGIGLLVTAAGGCSSGTTGGEAGWRHEIVEGEGVRTVRTLGGSVWGNGARLVEEVSVGVETGPDEYMLGSVWGLCLDDERIYVLDTAVPALRLYDRQGRYLKDIGRKGAGPGEFDRPMSVRVDPGTGRIFVRDDPQGRLTVYDGGGNPLDTWPTQSGFQTSEQMVLTPAGDVYTPVFIPSEDKDVMWERGLRRMGPLGAPGDTLRVPRLPFDEWVIEIRTESSWIRNTVPFSPSFEERVLPSLDVVLGVSTDYRFELRHRDGSRTVIEKVDWDKVPVEAAEARWHRGAAAANMRDMEPGWAWNGPEVPSYKPPFSGFLADDRGRIWVWSPGPGLHVEGCDEDPKDARSYRSDPCWKETWRFDIFDHQGRYLGRVPLPAGMDDFPEPYIHGDCMVALVTGPDEVPRVKVYRLEVPGS
jgi:hypothetical protein